MITNFSIIFISIIAGVLIKKYKTLPDNTHKAVNFWVITIALPAIALRYMPYMKWNSDLFFLLSITLIIFLFALALINVLSYFKPMDIKTKACLLLTIGFSNLSFLGFPLTEAYYGKEALKLAVICDQGGFLTLSSLGIFTASYAAGKTEKIAVLPILKKVLLFPPSIAFIFALIAPKIFNYDALGEVLNPILENLGNTMVPMALFSVGLQLGFKNWKVDKSLLLHALNYKLLLAPLIVFGISKLLNTETLITQVGTIEAAMAPMITGSIVATEFDLRPKLSSLILSFGILLSFLTTFLWYLIL